MKPSTHTSKEVLPTQTYYSIRTVRATSNEDAIEKVIMGDFDTTNKICDYVVTKEELLNYLNNIQS